MTTQRNEAATALTRCKHTAYGPTLRALGFTTLLSHHRHAITAVGVVVAGGGRHGGGSDGGSGGGGECWQAGRKDEQHNVSVGRRMRVFD